MMANLSNVSLQVAPVAIVAIGATLVILTGGIDLSPGSTVALVCCTLAILVKKMGLPLPVGIFLVLLLGVACGAINGFLSTYGRIPSFIVTLATMSIYRGLAFLITGGTPIFSVSDALEPIFYGKFLGIPLPFYYVVVLYALASLFLRNTIQGRAIYAVGGNESAARLTGIAVNRSKMVAFLIAGLTAGIGGVLTHRLAEFGLTQLRRRAGPAVDRRGRDRRRQPGRRLRQHDRHPDRRSDGGGRPERAEPARRPGFLAGDHPGHRHRRGGRPGHVERHHRAQPLAHLPPVLRT